MFVNLPVLTHTHPGCIVQLGLHPDMSFGSVMTLVVEFLHNIELVILRLFPLAEFVAWINRYLNKELGAQEPERSGRIGRVHSTAGTAQNPTLVSSPTVGNSNQISMPSRT